MRRPAGIILLSFLVVCAWQPGAVLALQIAGPGAAIESGGDPFGPVGPAANDDGPGDDHFQLGGTTPGKWGPAEFGTGAVVTYSFATGTGYATNEIDSGSTIVPLESFIPLPSAQIKAEVRRAFAAWEAAADLRFVEVPDDGVDFTSFFTDDFQLSTSGDIRIGGHQFDGPRRILAHSFFAPNFLASGAGDIHFDVAEAWEIGFDGAGFDIFQVVGHEIGHSIGLQHTTVPQSLMNSTYSEDFAGPQADDIAGAVFLYGPPVPVPEPATVWLALAGSLVCWPWLTQRVLRAAFLLPLPG